MSLQHVSRTGQIYYLHGKPGKNGRPNFYFSTDPKDPLVDMVPDGYEIYENVGGQVFLRRIPKKLISDEELKWIRAALTAHAEEWRHKIDVKKNIITVYEANADTNLARELAPWINPATEKKFRIQHAYYMAVLRFILVDSARRLFVAERFCFTGSVDDWINLGPSASLPVLIGKYVKHLGKDSFYDLV